MLVSADCREGDGSKPEFGARRLGATETEGKPRGRSRSQRLTPAEAVSSMNDGLAPEHSGARSVLDLVDCRLADFDCGRSFTAASSRNA